MKNKFYKIFLLSGVSLLSLSCVNDLEQVPEDSKSRGTVEEQFAQ